MAILYFEAVVCAGGGLGAVPARISLPPEGEGVSGNPILDMLTRIDGRLGRLEERQATLEKGQAALEKGQTSLRVDLMARMDRLSDQITLI